MSWRVVFDGDRRGDPSRRSRPSAREVESVARLTANVAYTRAAFEARVGE
jgi:hypothetical protein